MPNFVPDKIVKSTHSHQNSIGSTILTRYSECSNLLFDIFHPLYYYSVVEYFRRKQNVMNVAWFIATVIVLRSFIAPGFMISTSVEGGLKLIICDGPVSFTSQIKNNSSDHNHHDVTDEIKQEVHISPVCSHWATSSLLVINTIFEPVIIFIHSKEQTFYEVELITQYFDNTRDIRAPPSFS